MSPSPPLPAFGDTSHRTSPTLVAALKDKNITGVACGGATVVWASTVPAKLKGLGQAIPPPPLHDLHDGGGSVTGGVLASIATQAAGGAR